MDQENPDQHPRVSLAQLQLWLADPTTQKYKKCLKWLIEQNKEFLGSGDWAVADGDELLTTVSGILGQRDGIELCIDFESVFNKHEMLEVEQPEQPEEESTDGA